MRRLGLALAAGCIAGSAYARVFVPDSELDGADVLVGDGVCASAAGTCTLRAAVQEANALAGLDEIHLRPCLEDACTMYRIDIDASGNGEDAAASGDLDVRDSLVVRRDPAFARGLVHVIGDAGVADPRDRIWDIAVPPGAAASRFSDLLVANGLYADAAADGAGLRVAAGSRLVLERVVFYANFGDGHGIALSTRGEVHFRDGFVFDNHQRRDGPEVIAGGILHVGAGGRLHLDNVVVDDNSSFRGGGLLVEGVDARAEVRRAYFSNGGSPGNDISAADGAEVDVRNSTLSGGDPPLALAGGARIALVHVTMASALGYRHLVHADASGALLSLANSAVASLPVACDAPASALASLGGNVFAAAAPCALALHASDHVVDDLGLVEVRMPPPLEVMPGSWHRAMAPLAGSPVIDAADDAQCLADDQFGAPRPAAAGGARCDSGAVEWPLERIFADGFDGTSPRLLEAVFEQGVAGQRHHEHVVVER